ncbi:MAG: hypothetical protein LBR32_04150 [Propionibacteriaceae bacterium]|nr:hypothetical protein [Propionibacteriaceae bacterium]
MQVEATFSSVEDLLEAHPSVDLVVADLVLSRGPDDRVLQGPKAISALTEQGHRVCVYSDESRLLVVVHCFAAGAVGMVRKSEPLGASQAAFLRVAAGATVVPESMIGLAELLDRRTALPKLTGRQAEVLAARARGIAWDTLARRMGISTKTAQGHLDAAVKKMLSLLTAVNLDPSASPGDIERALGMSPGDLMDPAG